MNFYILFGKKKTLFIGPHSNAFQCGKVSHANANVHPITTRNAWDGAFIMTRAPCPLSGRIVWTDRTTDRHTERQRFAAL